MNRRDFLKLIGAAIGGATLPAAGVAPVAADEAPITPQEPLAQLEICGASYGVRSFNLEIASRFTGTTTQDVTVDIFGYPNSNVFSALHGMQVTPFSLTFAYNGGRYELTGKMLLANVDCLCNRDGYEAEITGKIRDLTISVFTKAL